MYTVSESYRAKMLDQIQTHHLFGTIDDVSFTDADVIGVSLTNRCAEKKVSLGSVNIGTLKLTFLTDILNRGEYYGKVITLSDSLYLGLDENDQEVWESVPIGTFYVAEATIYNFCKYIEQETDTTFGMTEEECLELPNGSEVLAVYEENNLKTFRDLLSAIAEMVGGFGYADRNGTWKIKSFSDTSILTIPKNRRMSGSSFSDYETYYDTVSYTDIQAKQVKYVGLGEGLTIGLGSQPFLQYGTAEAVTRRALAIIDAIKLMTYTPFSISMLPAMVALDLGDVISMTDDFSGDTSTGAVMNFTWTYNHAFKVQCYGDNPNLRASQSKTDKNIAGIYNSTVQNEVTFYNYTNLESISLASEEEVLIAELHFAAAQTTTVKIMHEFIFDMLKDLTVNGSYELRYYLDEEMLSYKPYESLSALVIKTEIPEEEEPVTAEVDPVNVSITRDFFYVLRDVEPNIRHTWRVCIITHGIDLTTIDVEHAHITIEGQRLYGENAYDGTIEVRETISKVSLVGMGHKTLEELIDVETPAVLAIVTSDNIEVYDLAVIDTAELSDAMQMFIQGGFYIQTESESNLTTEGGDRFITE